MSIIAFPVFANQTTSIDNHERFISGTMNQVDCVTDSQTKLMLIKAPTSTKYTWQDANKYVKTLTTCGFKDWRLPTREEQIALQTDIGNYAAFAWFNTHGFSNIQTDFYWSSETYAPQPKDAWGIYMYSSKVYNEVKTGLNYVWAVRSTK
jgi:hypothetical protein